MSELDFLQSADWARFQAAVGRTSIEHDGVYYYQTPLPLGRSYLYCPHPDVQSAEQFIDQSITVARQSSAWFVRIEPSIGSARIMNHEVGIRGKTRSTIYDLRSTLAVQPPDTWQVPLGSDEAMLAAMHGKTRYNVRLSEKRGVTVRFSTNPTDVEILTKILGKTGERAGIRLHPSSYYTTMLEILGQNFEPVKSKELGVKSDAETPHSSLLTSRLTVELAIAESDGQPVAAAIVGSYGERAIYLHGGSDYEQRHLMAPHLLHWRVMQRAATAGKTTYDLGGIAPEAQTANVEHRTSKEPETFNSSELSNSFAVRSSQFAVDTKHPWAGITRFKTGFGGQAVHYPPTVDLVVRPTLYSIYAIARRVRRGMA